MHNTLKLDLRDPCKVVEQTDGRKGGVEVMEKGLGNFSHVCISNSGDFGKLPMLKYLAATWSGTIYITANSQNNPPPVSMSSPSATYFEGSPSWSSRTHYRTTS